MQSEIEHIESLVKPGDFVFTRIDNILYKKVADTSCSWSSHVGLIIDQNDDGSFVVAESKVPRSTYSDFRSFVRFGLKIVALKYKGNCSKGLLGGAWTQMRFMEIKNNIDFGNNENWVF